MGLFEMYEELEGKNKLVQGVLDIFDFDHKGILSKKISLDYKLISNQPHVFFKCKDNYKLSFSLHDLQMKEDSVYWHMAAQEKKKAKFEGFKGYFDGRLRGYMGTEDQRLGICFRKGQIYKLRTNAQTLKTPLLNLMMNYLDVIKKESPEKIYG